jgi:rod shape determining protein RodA
MDIIPINLKLLSDLEDGSEEVSEGTQTKGGFVPEQHTDYIFTVGEEWGFVGALVVIALFVTLFLRVIYLAERQKTKFSRYMACVGNFIYALFQTLRW